MCDFCNTFDFSTAKIEISNNGQFAHIILAICNTRFDKSEQFKFCPVCGKDLSGNVNRS